jgi:hypothetical protein
MLVSKTAKAMRIIKSSWIALATRRFALVGHRLEPFGPMKTVHFISTTTAF